MTKSSTNSTANTANLVKTSEDLDLKNNQVTTNDMVPICSSLQRGIKFSGLNTVEGGCYAIPGINTAKRGPTGGALLHPGGFVMVTLPRKVWDEIQQKYGSLNVFTHKPAFLRELKDEKELTSKDLRDELKEVRTGMEPINPAATSTEAAKS